MRRGQARGGLSGGGVARSRIATARGAVTASEGAKSAGTVAVSLAIAPWQHAAHTLQLASL
jgi:hypothetical protein